MTFTAEQRAKAAETRQRNAADRKLKKQNEVTGTATTDVLVGTYGDPIPPDTEIEKIEPAVMPEASWSNLPLREAVEKLSDMKREYDMAAQIILQRQSREPVVWTCWTQGHKDIASKAAMNQCRKLVPDGKWVSKDDGYKDENGKISPQVTCSMICYQNYSEFRSKVRDRSRGL